VLTNAAREGARIAVLTTTTDAQVKAAVEKYMSDGGLPCVGGSPGKQCDSSATVNVVRNEEMGPDTASRITVSYPFKFMMLNPVIKLVSPSSKTGEAITMQSVALMRNES
jgi:hypothetical protein